MSLHRIGWAQIEPGLEQWLGLALATARLDLISTIGSGSSGWEPRVCDRRRGWSPENKARRWNGSVVDDLLAPEIPRAWDDDDGVRSGEASTMG